MQIYTFITLILLTGSSALAQPGAIVQLNNFGPPDRPFYYLSRDALAPAENDIQIQVLGGPVGGDLSPVINTHGANTFQIIDGYDGYFDAGSGYVPGVAAGAWADFEIRMWIGPDYGNAVLKGESDRWTQPTTAWDPSLSHSLPAKIVPLDMPAGIGIYLLAADYPPRIVQQPRSQTVLLGTDVTFEVQATVANSLEMELDYQWWHNGQPIPQANHSVFIMTQAQLKDAGEYWVTVSNPFGRSTSSQASLMVLEPSPLRLSAPGIRADAFRISFQTTIGSQYVVESADSPVGAEWQTVRRLSGNGRIITIEDKIQNTRQRFYRVRTLYDSRPLK